MKEENLIMNANERSIEAQPQTVKSAKSGRSSTRSNFSLVKQKVIDAYRKVESVGILTDEKGKKDCLKKCLEKALEGMKTYNEEGFKKDLSMRMARLINDKRFDRRCKKSKLCLYEEAQRLAWANERTFQQMLNEGVDQVKGFYTPNVPLYTIGELRSHILLNDVDPDDLDGRYSQEWFKEHPDEIENQDNAAGQTKSKGKAA
jgi:hypothetical protein